MQAEDAVKSWCAIATRITIDATSLLRLVTLLPGNFGRFAGGRAISPFPNQPPPAIDPNATIASLEADASSARATVAEAVSAAETAAADLAPTTAGALA